MVVVSRRARTAGLLLSSVVLSSIAVPVHAQSGQPFPTREQIQLPPATTIPDGTRVSVSTPTDRPSTCPFDTVGLTAGIREVRFVDVAGNALPPQVASVLASMRPSPGVRPLSQLCVLRDQAAARLSAAGYLAAVTIPQQEIDRSTGTARLNVILGRIVDVELVGDVGRQGSRIAARADRLKALYPLRTADLERELLIAGDNPGLDVRMALVAAPSGVPGELVGRLQVLPRTFALNANVSNLGSQALGREIASVRGELYGLTGLADVTFLGASTTLDFEEQWSIQGGHYLSLDNGVTIGGSLAYAESRPDIGLPLRSTSVLGAIEAYFPVVRTVASRVLLGGGLEIVDQKSRLDTNAGNLPLTRDRLRIAFLKVDGNRRWFDADGRERLVVNGTVQLRQGLDIFNASERGDLDGDYLPSRLDGDPTAMLARGGINVRTRSGPFILLGQVQGQYSAKPLLSFEEFSVGNYTIGRGYDPASASGDSALAARIQPSLVLNARSLVLEPYAFADAVRIWNEDEGSSDDGQTLASAGLGARAYIANRFVIDAGWAHPFDRPNRFPGAKRAPDRFLISVSAAFGPAPR